MKSVDMFCHSAKNPFLINLIFFGGFDYERDWNLGDFYFYFFKPG